jgi:hypothetical protein
MPSASYYRAQAQLLHSLSLTTSDPKLAERYRLRAQEYLRLSMEMPEMRAGRALDRVLSGFNEQQMRKA